jgi:hypothetical protein
MKAYKGSEGIAQPFLSPALGRDEKSALLPGKGPLVPIVLDAE